MIKRYCGQLLGQLDGLLPCIYISRLGASVEDMCARRTSGQGRGLFVVDASAELNQPDVTHRLGLLLPLNLCRDEAAKAALMEIPDLVKDTTEPIAVKRRAVQARLDAAYGGDLQMADRESLDGLFTLVPTAGLFRRLHDSFDYVTEVVDDPAGVVQVIGTERFRWRSYGDLMEWFHHSRGSDRFDVWSVFTPFFVCSHTRKMQPYNIGLRARARVKTPDEEPPKWFVVRADLPNAHISLRFEMELYGWAMLYVSLNGVPAAINLSQVYDPFPDLLMWAREVSEGDLPVEIEIDEEGDEAVLTVLRTDDPQRVLLRIRRKLENKVLLEGIVSRAVLAGALKNELIRFFSTEFDPKHWDMMDGEDPEDDYVQVKDVILTNAWLTSRG